MKSGKQEGFGIIEIIVAMGIMIIIASAGTATVLHSFSVNRLGDQETEATLYSQQGIEAVRSIRNQDWSSLSAGTYGIDSSGGSWVFSGSSNTSGLFTRQITIEAVERDGGNNISTSEGTIDPDTFKVTSTTTWDFSPTRSNTVELITYLTNFIKPIITVGDWSNPTEESTLDLTGGNNGWKIQVDGDYAYLIRTGGTDFVVINITDTSAPTVAGSLSLPDRPENIAVFGNYAYIASRSNSQELQVIDISTPSSPNLIGSYNAGGNANGVGVYVVGSTVYLVRASSGQDEFMSIDVSTPSSPSLIGSVNLGGGTNNEVVIIGNYAYIASDNNSQELRVVDISTPSSPSLVGSLDLSGNGNAETINGSSSTVVIGRDDGFIHIVSVSTPTSPSEVGSYDANSAVRDLSLDTDNNYVFIGTDDNASEFQVIDITTPSSPVLVGALDISPNHDINGVAYHVDKDRVFAAGEDNNIEFLIFQPQ